jgi:hypothetical protein
MIEILLLGMTLLGCEKKEHDDLFEQEHKQFLLQGDIASDENPVASIEEQNITPIQEQNTQKKDTQIKEAIIDPTTTWSDIQDTFSEKVSKDDLKQEPEKNIIIEGKPQGDAMTTLGQNEFQLFYYEEITDEVKIRINGKSYGEACTIPYDELRYVKVLHWGFDGQVHEGELIVNKAIAEDIVEIFKELYELKYPIERMVLVDEYDADDNKSMAANNTSAFNYRVVDGTNKLSLHSYGLAIDINPLYNPYVRTIDGKMVVTPSNGEKYKDRTLDCKYYIDTEDPAYKAFIKRGFTWGGEWKNQKDYQHFQKTFE